jgi:hypothetical protein
MDLECFFAGIGAGRVHGLLLGPAGLPEPVAYAVTSLVTTVVPARLWRGVPVPAGIEERARHRRLGQHLTVPHLPQGAPTSPALANLVCFRLDRRLAGLAASLGATYTRYVDDLTFSGDAAVGRDRFADLVIGIVDDEGFRVRAAKTSVTSAGRRQTVLGAVVNVRPTLPRPERDALRALLHNCARHGWRSQTRGRDPVTFRDHVLAVLPGRPRSTRRSATDCTCWPTGSTGRRWRRANGSAARPARRPSTPPRGSPAVGRARSRRTGPGWPSASRW